MIINRAATEHCNVNQLPRLTSCREDKLRSVSGVSVSDLVNGERE